MTLPFYSGRFFRCPQPTCRGPRCPATSDCCDDNSVSSTGASYSEQVTRYSVTVTELPLNCSVSCPGHFFNSRSSLTPKYTKVILGAVTLRLYVTGSMIQDQTRGSSKELMNPLWGGIYWFI